MHLKKLVAIALVMVTAVLAIFPRSVVAQVRITVNPSGYITSTCYTPADVEAEQAIRLRSQLMVIGLNCQESRYSGTQENLYAVYRRFVADHGPQFAAYESQMLNYFIRAGSGDPEADLARMSAEFGNKISLFATQTRTDMFCYKFSKQLLTVRHMNAGAFREWIAYSLSTHPVSHPMCR